MFRNRLVRQEQNDGFRNASEQFPAKASVQRHNTRVFRDRADSTRDRAVLGRGDVRWRRRHEHAYTVQRIRYARCEHFGQTSGHAGTDSLPTCAASGGRRAVDADTVALLEHFINHEMEGVLGRHSEGGCDTFVKASDALGFQNSRRDSPNASGRLRAVDFRAHDGDRVHDQRDDTAGRQARQQRHGVGRKQAGAGEKRAERRVPLHGEAFRGDGHGGGHGCATEERADAAGTHEVRDDREGRGVRSLDIGTDDI